MTMALQNESFNPYIEELVAQVQSCVLQSKKNPSRDILKIWADLFINAFSVSIDNVLKNQTSLMTVAKILNDASIRLPIFTKDAPKALSLQTLTIVAAQNPEAAAQLANLRFILNVLTNDIQKALAQYAADFLAPSMAGMDFRASLPFIHKLGFVEQINEDTARQIFRDTPAAVFEDAGNAEIIIMRTIRALNFESNQNLQTQHILTTQLIVPWIQQLLDIGNYSAAMRLEGLLFENYVRRQEEEQHYQESYRLWAGITEAAGLAVRKKLGPPVPVIRPGQKAVVGFFTHRASMLAHIQLLYTALQGIPNIPDLPYRIKIYVWSSHHKEMEEAFRKIGVEIVWTIHSYPLELPYMDRLLGLRKMMQEDGVQVLVWMCVMHMMGFAMGMGLAPRQIYWNAKYQVGSYNTPDDRITWHDNGDASVMVDGKLWRSVPMTFTSTQHTLDTQKLTELRKKFSGWKTILGTMAREDILNSSPFLHTVANILKHNPDAVYFYTGRNHLQAIQDIFKEHGVSHQTEFVGWVDTVLYANLVDIYLDSWPARSGLTAFNVFEAGKPFVSMILKDGGAIHKQFSSVPMIYDEQGALHFGVKELDQAFDHIDGTSRFFPVVSTEEEYIRVAQRLIEDTALRKKTGEAFGILKDRMSDSSRAGRKLDEILRMHLDTFKNNA